MPVVHERLSTTGGRQKGVLIAALLVGQVEESRRKNGSLGLYYLRRRGGQDTTMRRRAEKGTEFRCAGHEVNVVREAGDVVDDYSAQEEER